MPTSSWQTPTVATALRSPPGAISRCATTRASWSATSCYASSFRREDLSRLLDRIPRRRAVLSERRADAAVVVARAGSRRAGRGRPLPRPQEARRGGHGTGVSRRAREDGAEERHQGAEPHDGL